MQRTKDRFSTVIGLLKDQYKRADYGNELNGGWGFADIGNVLMTLDLDNLQTGATYKIAGEIFTLEESKGNPVFVKE